jgi:hypothetical protein
VPGGKSGSGDGAGAGGAGSGADVTIEGDGATAAPFGGVTIAGGVTIEGASSDMAQPSFFAAGDTVSYAGQRRTDWGIGLAASRIVTPTSRWRQAGRGTALARGSPGGLRRGRTNKSPPTGKTHGRPLPARRARQTATQHRPRPLDQVGRRVPFVLAGATGTADIGVAPDLTAGCGCLCFAAVGVSANSFRPHRRRWLHPQLKVQGS